MNEALISEWNSKVDNTDTIYHLGDFSFGKRRTTEAVLNRLSGNKIFILGNHCLAFQNLYAEYGEVYHYKTFKRNKTRIVLFHYPIMSWHSKEHGAVHLHGHMHGGTSSHKKHEVDGAILDVGYDNVGEIITLEKAMEMANDY
jgi:calcineurin-like phosphoesterase family protein